MNVDRRQTRPAGLFRRFDRPGRQARVERPAVYLQVGQARRRFVHLGAGKGLGQTLGGVPRIHVVRRPVEKHVDRAATLQVHRRKRLDRDLFAADPLGYKVTLVAR